MRYFARSGGMQGFEQLVIERGGDPAALLREAGLPRTLCSNPELYVPYPALAQLLTLAAARCATPDFGVRLGLRHGLEVLGPLASFLCLQASIGEAMQLLMRHMDFHAHGVQLTRSLEGDEVVLRLGFAFETEVDCAQLGALSVLQLMRGLQQVQTEPLPPHCVTLCLPVDEALWRRETGHSGMLASGASGNSLRFPAALLGRPVAMTETLRQRLTHQWQADNIERGLSPQVSRIITTLLPTGECSLAQVAAIIGLHPRTLQQRLKQEQRSYGRLLREARYTLACQYLARTEMGITALALNLGYEDVAVFSRAFLRWTGQPPSEWRRARHDR